MFKMNLIWSRLFSTVAFGLSLNAFATTYYVSPSGADLNNSGTDESHPLKTINQAASFANAGDTILIHAGTYPEQVTFAHSGSAGAPIRVEAYPNEVVVINGADRIPSNNFKSLGGGVYSAPMADLGQGKNQVFVDGMMVPEATYPAQTGDFSHPTFAQVQSVDISKSVRPGTAWGKPVQITTSNITLHDSGLNQPANYWQGALVHFHNSTKPWSRWVSATATINSSGPGWIRFSFEWNNDGEGDLTAGNSYYITGVQNASPVGAFSVLSRNNQWLRDSATGSLTIQLADSPANHKIEVKARQNALNLAGRSYIELRNVNIFGAAVMMDSGSSNNLMDGFLAQYVSQFAVVNEGFQLTGFWNHATTSGLIMNGNKNTFRNCEIAYSAGNGVAMLGTNQTLSNCSVHDIDSSATECAGVYTQGSGHIIDHNTMFNAGRTLIVHRQTKAAQITHNILHDAGLQMTDLGATYSENTDGGGTMLAYNVIYNINANEPNGPSSGIYLDNGTVNFNIHHNVIWNAPAGIKLNPTNGATIASGNYKVYNNTTYNISYKSVAVGFQTLNGKPNSVVSSVVQNNLFYNGQETLAGFTYTNNLTNSNPGFMSPSSGNFQLQPSSPAASGATPIAGITSSANPSYGAYDVNQAPFTAGSTVGATVIVPSVGPVPSGHGSSTDAFSTILAVSQLASSNGQPRPVTGPSMGYLTGYSWLKYSAVDFGSGAQGFTANLSVRDPSADQKFELHLDSPTGALIGTMTVAGTSATDWYVFQNQNMAITPTSGVHDLYIVIPAGVVGVANLRSFSFTTQLPASLSPVPQMSAYKTINAVNQLSSSQGTPKPVQGAMGYLNGFAWLKYQGLDFGGGAKTFTASIAVENDYAGRKIELRLDSPIGPVVGVLTVQGTSPNDWYVYQNQSTTVSNASGVHDLYLVVQTGNNGSGNLMSFSFAE